MKSFVKGTASFVPSSPRLNQSRHFQGSWLYPGLCSSESLLFLALDLRYLNLEDAWQGLYVRTNPSFAKVLVFVHWTSFLGKGLYWCVVRMDGCNFLHQPYNPYVSVVRMWCDTLSTLCFGLQIALRPESAIYSFQKNLFYPKESYLLQLNIIKERLFLSLFLLSPHSIFPSN